MSGTPALAASSLRHRTMSSTFWDITFGVGIAQAAFLTLAVVLRGARNRRAAAALVAIVLVFAAMSAVELVESNVATSTALLLTYLAINVELVIGPLVLLFVRFLADPSRRLSRMDLRHALPFVVGVGLWLGLWWMVEDPERPFGLELGTVTTAFVIAKALVQGTYAVLVARALAPLLRRPYAFTSGGRRVGAGWLSRALSAGAAVVACIYLVVFADQLGMPLPFEPDQIGSLLLTLVVYGITLALVLRPGLLTLRPLPPVSEVEAGWASDVAHLSAVLERKRPWLDPELGLRELAAATGFSESRLSTLINEGLATTFYELLHRHRLAEFERLAADPELSGRTVLELALGAGFRSKASFYRKFKEAHGTTPTAWRERVFGGPASQRAG